MMLRTYDCVDISTVIGLHCALFPKPKAIAAKARNLTEFLLEPALDHQFPNLRAAVSLPDSDKPRRIRHVRRADPAICVGGMADKRHEELHINERFLACLLLH